MNPIVVEKTRSGLVENTHRGAISVVGPDGGEIFSVGDTAVPHYPRSALKFVQVLPFLEADLDDHLKLENRSIALLCGSHNGEPAHVALVEEILAKSGHGEDCLCCGILPPLSLEVQRVLANEKTEPGPIFNNCSGKHAGFLALAKHMNAPLKTYLDFDHPVQVAVRNWVRRIFDMEESDLHFGIDGCSAPNYAMPLRSLAHGFSRLAQAEHKIPEVGRMIEAVTSEAFMVGGTGRYCTELMDLAGKSVFGKLGADGIYAAGLRGRGIGIAVKIDDGATGPQYAVVQALLEALGAFPDGVPDQLHRYAESPILTHNKSQVGETRIHPRLMTQILRLEKILG